MNSYRGLVFLLLTLSASFLAECQVPKFEAGDKVAFIGDSITHGGRYHSYIYNYYLTRFPTQRFEIYNCGISGDKATSVLKRLDFDVFDKPFNVAVVMLGMNDVSRGLYANPEDTEGADKKTKALDDYRSNMEELFKKIDEKAHPKFILIEPSPFDETAELQAKKSTGVNGALGTCSKYVEELAASNKASIVDFYHPMTELNLSKQKEDPAFTLIGKDRIHPGQVGHTVMAYYFLKAQGVPAIVSETTIDAAESKIVKSENADVSELKTDNQNQVEFKSLEKALPFMVDEQANAALSMVPIEKDLDREILTIQNLKPGKYSLKIDDQVVGEYSEKELNEGVNLAMNSKTPQFVQSKAVADLNERRRSAENQLRNIVHAEIRLRAAKVDLTDSEKVKAYIEEYAANPKADKYIKGLLGKYLNSKAAESQTRSSLKNDTDKLWTINQPKPHHFEIRVSGQ